MSHAEASGEIKQKKKITNLKETTKKTPSTYAVTREDYFLQNPNNY